MAITSYPFDGQSVSEAEYSLLFRELASHSGIADSVGGTGFAVAVGTGMRVTVAPGYAIVRGHAVHSTAVETLAISPASSAARIDRVVLRLDPTANEITLEVLEGVPGAGAPALTQSHTAIYEMSLATVAVPVGASSVTASHVVSERRYLGNTVGAWTSGTRPSDPRTARLGLNASTNTWEWWDGTEWRDLAASVAWTDLDGRPGAFPPAAHTHPWNQVTEKPSTFPPDSHTHTWASVTGKPNTFAPSSHTHSWGQITGKPNTFAPSSHTHSNYVTSGGTVAWANGSKKPHTNAASGSGTWYAVWVEGDGTFARNTSSIRFKENVRDFDVDPDATLALRPVIYDRRTTVDDRGEVKLGRKDEVGLIAEEAEAAGLEWLVTYLDGEVDGLRYDLLGVALLPVVQRQEARIADLEERLARLEEGAS